MVAPEDFEESRLDLVEATAVLIIQAIDIEQRRRCDSGKW